MTRDSSLETEDRTSNVQHPTSNRGHKAQNRRQKTDDRGRREMDSLKSEIRLRLRSAGQVRNKSASGGQVRISKAQMIKQTAENAEFFDADCADSADLFQTRICMDDTDFEPRSTLRTQSFFNHGFHGLHGFFKPRRTRKTRRFFSHRGHRAHREICSALRSQPRAFSPGLKAGVCCPFASSAKSRKKSGFFI